jgi:predicted dehydrogenase
MSIGTERRKVETGRQSLLGKAQERPEQVRLVVEKAKRDGVRETVQAVRARLDQPSGLGYSAAGVVQSVGTRVSDLVPGDRVACGGEGHAGHAEVDRVPGNLCVPVPPGVNFEEAAFATVGSIAMHAVRQAGVTLGERVAVVGLGLIGQLAAQLLQAAGCTVVGIDLAEELVERALALGAIDTGHARSALQADRLPDGADGCDAVVITAATTSTDPIELAARLCRDRGRVVVVGDVGMNLPRATYYEKELDIRLSRSYGPGRYDSAYEERGLDYPIGYVRWTERRNMAAFLSLVAAGKVNVEALVTRRVSVDEAAEAYAGVVSGAHSPLGIVIGYEPSAEPHPLSTPAERPIKANLEAVGVVGAGSFAQRILIPGLAKAGFDLTTVASASGLTAHAAAKRFGFRRTGTPDDVLADPDAGLVVIATRHSSHAALAIDALRSGKEVFVEKPPCISLEELGRLRAECAARGATIAVGFNRRHAPLAGRLRDHVTERGGPIGLVYRVNTALLREGHWLDDLDDGGGRLIGEGCHFVDFACWLIGALPTQVSCVGGGSPGHPLAAARRFSIVLGFGEGSVATIVYGDGGADGVSKEYVEAHAEGRSAVLDDFRTLALHTGRRVRRARERRRNKGHTEQLQSLREVLSGRRAPAAPDPLDTMAVTFAALTAMETGKAVSPHELGYIAQGGKKVDSRMEDSGL